MKSFLLIISCFLITGVSVYSQKVNLNTNTLEPVDVSISIEQLKGKKVVKVVKDPKVKEVDEPTFAKIKGIDLSPFISLNFKGSLQINSTLNPANKKTANQLYLFAGFICCIRFQI